MQSLPEILEKTCVESTEDFSTPTEIRDFCNSSLNALYSAKEVSLELVKLGWLSCGKDRLRRGNKSCRYWHKNGKRLLLDSSVTGNVTHTPNVTPKPDSKSESLASAEKRYKIARADKEEGLSVKRFEEGRVAKTVADHQKWKAEKEQGKWVRITDVQDAVNTLATEMRIAFGNIPQKYSTRWASVTDEGVIRKELESEINEVLMRCGKGGFLLPTPNDVGEEMRFVEDMSSIATEQR